MAHDSGLGSILPIAIVGGIGYWLYSSGMLSSLFGSSAAATTAPTTTPPAGGTNPVVAPPAPPAPPAPNAVAPQPCGPGGSLAKILALAQKANPGLKLGPDGTDTLTIDEWGYYGNQYCTGLPDQVGWNADTLFPNDPNRGGPLNWNAAAGWGTQRGLSAVNPRNRGRRVGRRLIGTNMVRSVA